MRAMNSTWLTSFGDLLTLLLCFILVVMAHSADLRVQKTQENQKYSQKNEHLSQPHETVGKLLASKPMSEYRHQSLGFTESDFDLVSKTLNIQGLSKLSGLNLEEAQKIELQVCNFGQETVEDLFRQVVADRRNWELIMGLQACKESAEPIKLLAWFK